MNANFKLNGKTIETKRLILRPFKESDLDDFFEYASVEGVGEMAGWKHHASKEESQQILNLFIEQDKTFAICLKNSGKVIGSLGVEMYGREESLTEFNDYVGRKIGYVLSKEYWGKGLMPEAVKAVIDYLFNELDYDFLTCGYYDFNKQSKRVQDKCGFKQYRKLIMDTRMGTQEPGVLNLLTNPNKKIVLNFSHPETLIYTTDVKAKSTYDYKTIKALTHVTTYKKKNPKKVFTFWIIYAVFFAVFIYMMQVLGIDEDMGIIKILPYFIIVMELILHFGMPRLQYNMMAKMKEIENEFTFTEDALKVVSKNENYSGEAEVKYAMIPKVFETSKYFFIYQSKNQVYAVDKATFENGNTEEIRSKLMSFVGKKYIGCKY